MSYEDKFVLLMKKFEEKINKDEMTPKILKQYHKDQAKLLRELAEDISNHAEILEDFIVSGDSQEH